MDDELRRLLEGLHEQVKAELENKSAIDHQAQATERLKQAELARIRRLDQIVERYANLGELIKDTEQTTRELIQKVDGLIDVFQRSILSESSVQEWHEDFSEQITEIKYILLLILSNNQKEKEQVRKRLEKNLLKQQYENLEILKEQEAQFGGMAPLHLLNQIKNIEIEIGNLEQE